MKTNQLKAGVLLTYLSELIMVISGLIYTPIMLRMLGQSEYGVYTLAASTVSYLALLNLGFNSSYIRFYSRYKAQHDEQGLAKMNGVYMTVFFILAVICLFVGIILVINVEKIFGNSLSSTELHKSRILMSVMIFNTAISFPGSVFGSFITAKEQYVFQKGVNVISNICTPFITLPLLFAGYKSIGVTVVQTCVSVSALIVNIFFCFKKLHISFDFSKFDFKLLREMFLFSFWVLINQVIDQANWSVDKFILGIYGGTIVVAIYGIASQINSLYMMFSSAISGIFVPRVNRIVAETNDNSALTNLFIRVGRIQFMVIFLILTGFVFFGRYFIMVWAGIEYSDAYIICLLLIIPVSIPLVQNTGIYIQMAKNKHQFRSVAYLFIAGINIIVTIPLAKMLGGIGAAIGTAGSLLVGNGIIMNIYYHKVIGLDIIAFWKSIFSILPSMSIPIVCGAFMHSRIRYDNLVQYAMMIFLYMVIYGVSVFFLGMNENERCLFPLWKKMRGR